MFISLFLVLIGVTSGALINPPDNIVCFPERDFCTLENFKAQTDQPLLIEVNRNGAIVGSAMGTVSGGNVAFEINHPGGLCWGAGTNLKVTPDLQPGDLITVKRGALLLGDSIIQNGHITSFELVGTTVTIKGFVASNVVPANMEVRIVNPLLLGTTVQKRQVNAVFGPLTGNVGYSSGLQVAGTAFTANFTFNTQQAADIAGSGEAMSLSMWQVTSPAGDRQGLTISEFGEVGGPWSAICPASPQTAQSPIPHGIAVSGNLIKWSPGQEIIGAPATTGFSVNVLRGNQVYGYRVPKTDNQVAFDLTPLGGGDIIEIRSMIGSKMSDSFVSTYQPQDIVPTIASIPVVSNPITQVKTDLVILDSNTGQIVYTIDGSAVLGANKKISPSAILYHTPIHVTSAITLKAVSFDRAGNFSAEMVGKFAPADIPLPQAITVAPTAVVQNGGVTLSWTKPSDPSISAFGVQVFLTNGTQVNPTRPISATTMIISDLVPGTSYRFSVLTQNAGGSSAPSPKTAAIVFPSPTDTITITGATWKANSRFRVEGTASTTTVVGQRTATVHAVNANGSIGAAINRRGTTTPISAQITCIVNVCSFLMDIRNGAVPVVKPGNVYVKSSGGGVSGPFVVG